jgi:Zn finger protein HypA/HybF involved in hydrogenase expression
MGEKMTEYIRREDLMERAGRWQLNTREAIAEMIMSVPSADVVERKRGEWFDRGSLSCRCSNCGCKANKEYSFCPNCGADMRGRKDG